MTLDSHHKKHIAHKAFWSDIRNDIDNKGNMPANFDEITYESLKLSQENNGNKIISTKDGKRWFPRDASLEVIMGIYSILDRYNPMNIVHN